MDSDTINACPRPLPIPVLGDISYSTYYTVHIIQYAVRFTCVHVCVSCRSKDKTDLEYQTSQEDEAAGLTSFILADIIANIHL